MCDRANTCTGLLLAVEPSASTEASHFCTMQKVGDKKRINAPNAIFACVLLVEDNREFKAKQNPSGVCSY
jgi:hypothetical protein